MVKTNIEYFYNLDLTKDGVEKLTEEEIEELIDYYVGKDVEVMYNKAGLETKIKGTFIKLKPKISSAGFIYSFAVDTTKTRRMLSQGNILTINETYHKPVQVAGHTRRRWM